MSSSERSGDPFDGFGNITRATLSSLLVAAVVSALGPHGIAFDGLSPAFQARGAGGCRQRQSKLIPEALAGRPKAGDGQRHRLLAEVPLQVVNAPPAKRQEYM
jgi:hypothetical protein